MCLWLNLWRTWFRDLCRKGRKSFTHWLENTRWEYFDFWY